MAQWIQLNAPGAPGAPGAAGTSGGTPAPNVTAATCAPAYGMVGNDSSFAFAGTITLPTSDPNYSHLAEIRVEVQESGDANWINVATIAAASFGGSSVAYTGTDILQGRAASSWTARFVAVNEQGATTASPYTTGSVAVRASAVNSATGVEASSSAWTVDANTRQLYTRIDCVPVLNGNQVPQNATKWISEDNGATATYIGWDLISSVGQTVSIRRYKPAAGGTFKVYFCAGAVGGDPTRAVAVSTLPYEAQTSGATGAITVSAMALPAANVVTALTVAAGAGGSWPYNSVTPDGRQYFAIPSLTVSDAAAIADKNAAVIRITAQDLDAGGVAIGPEQPFFLAQVGSAASHSYTSDALLGDYGTTGVGYTRTGNVAAVGLRVYVCNWADPTGMSFANPACATLQTSIGAAGLTTVTVAAGGALPSGEIPASRLTGLGAGLGQGPDGTPYVKTGGAVIASPVANPDFESGLTGWTAVGSGASASSSSPESGSGDAKIADGSSGLYQSVVCSSGQVVALTGYFRSEARSLPPNAGFESGLSDYTQSGWVLDSTVSHSGSASAKGSGASTAYLVAVMGTTGEHSMDCAVGRTVTFSVYAKSTAGAVALDILVHFLNSSGSAISSDAYTTISANTGWAQYSVTTAAAPSGTAYVQAYIQPHGTLGASDTWWVDDLSLSDGASHYADGTAKVAAAFYGSGGALISTAYSSGVSNTGTWTQGALSATAPSGTATVRLYAIYPTGSTRGVWYADNVACTITTAGSGGGITIGPDNQLMAQLAGPIYADTDNSIKVRIAPDFTVTGAPGSYTLSVASINLAKAVNFGTNPGGTPFFAIAGGLFNINAVGCNYLIAGDALFTGQATFAYSGGGKVTINSVGITLADVNSGTPNATVTVASTGVSLVHGSNNVQVTAYGAQINDAYSNQVILNSSGIAVKHGSTGMVVYTSGQVAIVGPSNYALFSGGDASLNSLGVATNLYLSGIPTASTGLPAGAVWRSGSLLLIV